jgi:predicted transcriptional regulator
MEGMPPERTIDERTLPPPVGDWAGMDDDSEHLKVWVSEEVNHAADLLADQYNNSKVVIVRNALVIHVFGRLAFDQAVMHGYLKTPRGYAAEVVNPKALYVAEREAHERGQQTDMARLDPAAHRELLAASLPATVGLRIAVPAKLKDDLQRLAAGAGKELSAYCREVLTAYFLGAARAPSASG